MAGDSGKFSLNPRKINSKSRTYEAIFKIHECI